MTQEQKESLFELQKIDCNCNECAFMVRDLNKFNKWKDWNEKIQLEDFERNKAREIIAAKGNIPYNAALVAKAENLKFQFDKANLIYYGNCSKLNKAVSFIPNTCQLETQDCFVHRKELI